MATGSSPGKCRFCDGVFAKAAMTNHLKACKASKAAQLLAPESQESKQQLVRIFHLVVEGRYQPQYWMHLEVPAAAKLKVVDEFLRHVWVECCWHLSAFTIGDTRYYVGGSRDLGGRSMNVALYRVLSPGTKFSYEYDFGSSTHLVLRVLSERKGGISGTPVQILARNEPPAITCDVCGKLATQVCTGCMWSDEGWLCNDCAREHECGEERFLPVVNSPRVGVCGYAG